DERQQGDGLGRGRRRGRLEAHEGEEARRPHARGGRLPPPPRAVMGVRAHVVVRGRVQGVWFRGSMQDEAQRLGVAGWVRNRADGAVEAEVEGEETAVEALVVWARRGPRGARVSEVEVDVVEPRGERGGFEIRG